MKNIQNKKCLIIVLSLILLLLFGQITTAISIHYPNSNQKNSLPVTPSLQYIVFQGKVESTSGDPLGGVKIEVTEDTQDKPRTYEGYTSVLDGVYAVVFPVPTVYHYYVKASKDGYQTQIKEVTVQTIPDIVYVDFTLVKKSRSINLIQKIVALLENYNIFQKIIP